LKISKKTKEKILATIPLIQAEPDKLKREDMLTKANFKLAEICEVCQSPTKMYGLCYAIEKCKWDSSYTYFKEERPVKNSADCKNVLDDECIAYCESLQGDNKTWANRCLNCNHFEVLHDSN
jgi:hypothetical protein